MKKRPSPITNLAPSDKSEIKAKLTEIVSNHIYLNMLWGRTGRDAHTTGVSEAFAAQSISAKGVLSQRHRPRLGVVCD
jgi:hypothetical protein